MSTWKNGQLLRTRDGQEARVSFVELFFDLVYVFAVTQISHHLLGHLTLWGALEALVLWFAVWLGWQYTAWVTNWFDPEKLQIRLMLFAVMGAGLMMAAALPEAFEGRALVFALAYVAIQLGRHLFVLISLGGRHPLAPNFQRMLCWLCISASFWVAGALVEGHARLAFWAVAVACEYFSPMAGFIFPGLGRSRTSDWTIEGGHLAERCQLFMIVALGESILVTGASLSHHAHWDAPTVIAFLVAFLGSLAMWWVYFDTGSKDGSHVIAHSPDPGRMGAYFHYVHVTMVGGVIISAVASELVIAHPDQPITTASAAVLIGGPLCYLIGNVLYKKAVYGRFPLSHLAGLAALLMLAPLSYLTDLLMVGALAAAVLVGVAVWEGRSRRAPRTAPLEQHPGASG
jgi:low temperature requirement protein LtrA